MRRAVDVQWRISLLGELRVEGAGRAITRFRTQKAASLLAYLAYHPRSHLRDQLIELLWSDGDPQAARNNLSRELSWLRDQLEPPGVPPGAVIVADRATVRLNPDAATTDVAAFETALQAAERAGSPAERTQHLVEAIEAYGGELLPGYYDGWVLQEREWLADRYFQALGQLLAHLEQAGEFSRALEYARRGVRTDPLREETHRDLIRLLAAAGQPEAALRQYHDLQRRLREELQSAPAAATGALAREIERLLAQDQSVVPLDPSPPMVSRPSGHLPAPLTRFFGRETDLARLGEMLGRGGTRLVTLAGPGGSGKTRLALEMARHLVSDWQGAVWFVPLADLTDAGLIAASIRDAMGLPRSPEAEPREQIVAALRQRRALLLLDNFEHLVDEGAALVRELLERVPGLTCLVTSRRCLNLAGEHELSVPPLPTPAGAEGPEGLVRWASVRLFVDRAQGVRPDFRVTPANAAAVATLCDRLEGIPLALELAAARAGVLTVTQMLVHTEDRFTFLVSRQRDATERHRTLRAAIDWSYRLLRPEQQRFFARLPIFRGGWGAEAAAAVCEEPLALGYLEQLRECSLVLAEEQGEEIRFRMLETLREYAREQLAPEEWPALARRHAQYYLALAEAAAQAPKGLEQALWLERLEEEHDNLRAALEWCQGDADGAEAGLRLAAALSGFWEGRGYWAEGRQRLEAALSREAAGGGHRRGPVVLAARAEALSGAGHLAEWQADYTAAGRLFEESLAIWQQLGNRWRIASVIRGLGKVAHGQGDYEAARRLLGEALSIDREIGNRRQQALDLYDLGTVALAQGDYLRAKSLCEEADAIDREFGRGGGALLLLGGMALKQGDPAGARRIFEECLAIFSIATTSSPNTLTCSARFHRTEPVTSRREALGACVAIERRNRPVVVILERRSPSFAPLKRANGWGAWPSRRRTMGPRARAMRRA